jgi:hypothetical protein
MTELRHAVNRQMTEMRKKLTIFLEDDLHRPARIRIADEDTSFQAVLEGLIREWLSGGMEPAAALAKVRKCDGPERAAHDLLEEIFATGSEEDIAGITVNLANFVQAIGSPARRKKRRKAG